MTKILRELSIPIPEGIEVQIEKGTISVKGKKGEAHKELRHPRLTVSLADKTVHIVCPENKPTINDKMMINTFKAHVRNLFHGVQEGYRAKLKICSGHFPITVTIENNIIVIKNFLGEKTPRKAALYPGVKVKIEGDIISLEGIDKESVGQTAARIENATRITNRDRRVFQDGCYITLKPGEEE